MSFTGSLKFVLVAIFVTLCLRIDRTAATRGTSRRRQTSSASTSLAIKRLQKEYSAIQKEPVEGITAQPRSDDDMMNWTATIHGPDSTPYAGGVFKLRLKFPRNYPMEAPVVTFATKIYHPNIDPDRGDICLNVLGGGWSAALTIPKLLLSIRSLLADPNHENEVLTSSYLKHYESRAKRWTEKYAKSSRP